MGDRVLGSRIDRGYVVARTRPRRPGRQGSGDLFAA
jgi:hypothetical protein